MYRLDKLLLWLTSHAREGGRDARRKRVSKCSKASFKPTWSKVDSVSSDTGKVITGAMIQRVRDFK